MPTFLSLLQLSVKAKALEHLSLLLMSALAAVLAGHRLPLATPLDVPVTAQVAWSILLGHAAGYAAAPILPGHDDLPYDGGKAWRAGRLVVITLTVLVGVCCGAAVATGGDPLVLLVRNVALFVGLTWLIGRFSEVGSVLVPWAWLLACFGAARGGSPRPGWATPLAPSDEGWALALLTLVAGVCVYVLLPAGRGGRRSCDLG